MSAEEVIALIESVAPLSQQESWDNSGLQIGQRNTEVSSALLCTDVNDAVVDEAIEKGCQMIVSHHPLLFHGLKHICGDSLSERCAVKAIKNGIVIYSAHTSMDKYQFGVSGKMAEKLGIAEFSILSPAEGEVGLGVIGNLPEPLSLQQFLALLKKQFRSQAIRYVPSVSERKISRVALCGGAGSEFLEDAVSQGADAFVSADFKYHEFLAADGRINVFDIGHFESEQFTKDIFRSLLDGVVNCIDSENDIPVIQAYLG